MSLAKILHVSSSGQPQFRELLDGIDSISLEAASSGQECCSALRAASYCAVLASFPLPDCTPDELLAEILHLDPALPVLIHDAAGTFADAVRLTKAGAEDYFGMNLDPEGILRHMETARELQRSRDLAALSAAVNRPQPRPGASSW